jgi:hypothetical protein
MKGCLQFQKLIDDGILNAVIDPLNEDTYIPFDSYALRKEGKEEGMVIRYGNHDGDHKMEGYGRKMWISIRNGLSKVWEGQFTNDEINGFGRYIKMSIRGECVHHVGYFKDGLAHGYGKRIIMLEKKTGLFVNDKYQ